MSRCDDPWARWFAAERQRSGSEASAAYMQRELEVIRDRLLDKATLAGGEHVLDAGAGTGLLAVEACRRVGASGRVLALDQSQRVLAMMPPQTDASLGPIERVAGRVERLPLRAATVDVVVMRSVLMYLDDKAGAVCELRRVLRPGGRMVAFEPINRVSAAHMWRWELDLGPIAAEHGRVMAHLEATWKGRDAMMRFDERDLVTCCVGAGFRSVSLVYEYTYSRGVRAPALLSAWLRDRQTATMPSYEEAARAVLGTRADEHLRHFDRMIEEQPAAVCWANAWITARRE
jgi:arsenite methyltransferase